VSLEQKKARYRVTSTVFLKMISTNPVYGDLEIAGTLSKLVMNYYRGKPIVERRLGADGCEEW
jgi:hypothetical protein